MISSFGYITKSLKRNPAAAATGVPALIALENKFK
jgi:hypothetical protein